MSVASRWLMITTVCLALTSTGLLGVEIFGCLNIVVTLLIYEVWPQSCASYCARLSHGAGTTKLLMPISYKEVS